jgi:multisubunit Na+/H+ antiporter MnhE subunit
MIAAIALMLLWLAMTDWLPKTEWLVLTFALLSAAVVVLLVRRMVGRKLKWQQPH